MGGWMRGRVGGWVFGLVSGLVFWLGVPGRTDGRIDGLNTSTIRTHDPYTNRIYDRVSSLTVRVEEKKSNFICAYNILNPFRCIHSRLKVNESRKYLLVVKRISGHLGP